MDKVRTVIFKEWSEVFKNRLVFFTVAFLPLVFVALPVITMLASGEMGAAGGDLNEAFPGADVMCVGLDPTECMEIYFINLYAFMFMILPVAIPVTIAAYSIVGEKTTRSLEPLLATPITTVELLVGKALSAIIPAVLATWLSFGIFAVVMYFQVSRAAFAYLLDPLWFLAIFVAGPLMTLLAVSVAMMISSRVSDPRVAEQISMLIILPIIIGVVGQSAGVILIDRQLVLIVVLVLLVLDAVLVYLGVQAFQRESILTRWK